MRLGSFRENLSHHPREADGAVEKEISPRD
jgi:hypothetical protein